MRFVRQALVPLVLVIAVTFASNPIELLVPEARIRAVSQPLATPPPATDVFSWDMNVAIQRRARYGQPAQKPLNGCPEVFDYPRMGCESCGGEDPAHPGTCSKPTSTGGWRCACDPGPPPSPVTTTVVMATVGTDVATGTYELETLTQYSKLREHITVMTTTTDVSATTTASGDSAVKTVAAVVIAGGVAWFLAASSGAGAAAGALTPPENAPEHDDDKQCPNPKENCKDCGGNIGMCTTGQNSGCGCDETECPADGADNQPDCSDETGCAGQNGQCTTGEFEGCNCKETDCPDLEKYTFWCNSDCGGNDGTGKCKGDPDDDPPYLWKGCPCGDDPDFTKAPVGLKRPDFGTHQKAWANLPDITYTSAQPSPTATSLPAPQCDMGQSSEVPYNVFSPGVYKNFCNAINGGDKTKAFSKTFDSKGNALNPSKKMKRTPPANPDTYSSYTFALDWTGGDGSCSSECSNVFYTIAQSPCGHTASEQNIMASQATLDTGCGKYSYKIVNTAPPKPTATTVVGTKQDSNGCTNPNQVNTVEFSLSDAEAAIKTFCTQSIDLPQPNASGGGTVQRNFLFSKYMVNLAVGWSSYGQYACGSITNPDETRQSTVTPSQCSQYLLSAVNDCDTLTTSNKKGGLYTWSGPIGCVDFHVSGAFL